MQAIAAVSDVTKRRRLSLVMLDFPCCCGLRGLAILLLRHRSTRFNRI